MKHERGGIVKGLVWLLVLALVVSLGAAVAYLLAERNYRRFRFRAVDNHAVVERGRRWPVGFESYTPPEESLKSIYAPLPIPPGTKLETSEIFEDRIDLDRALCGVLATWTRSELERKDKAAFDRAATYVDRCDELPGVSDEQRRELDALRGDIAYRKGEVSAEQIQQKVEEALKHFERAIKLGTSLEETAKDWISRLRERLEEAPAPTSPDPDDKAPAKREPPYKL